MSVNPAASSAKILAFPSNGRRLNPPMDSALTPYGESIIPLPQNCGSKYERMWQRVRTKLVLCNTGCFQTLGLDKSVHFEMATETTIVLSAPSIFLEKWVKKHCMKLLMAYWSMELDDGEKLRQVQIEVRSASRVAPCHAKARSLKAL